MKSLLRRGEPDPTALVDSPAYRAYARFVEPFEATVCRLWPSLLAFQIVLVGRWPEEDARAGHPHSVREHEPDHPARVRPALAQGRGRRLKKDGARPQLQRPRRSKRPSTSRPTPSKRPRTLSRTLATAIFALRARLDVLLRAAHFRSLDPVARMCPGANRP